jgi:hypothetical protein
MSDNKRENEMNTKLPIKTEKPYLLPSTAKAEIAMNRAIERFQQALLAEEKLAYIHKARAQIERLPLERSLIEEDIVSGMDEPNLSNFIHLTSIPLCDGTYWRPQRRPTMPLMITMENPL